MKKILIYTLIFMLPFALYAQDSTAVAQTVELPVSKSVLQGDSAYAKADYATAIAVYEAILAEGNEAASLYYNLGNAYFKSDEIAKAILNYERALLLDPSDKDIRFNLEFARSKTVDKVTEGYTIFFVRWIEELINTMSMDAWCILGITAFVLLLVSLLFFL
ncbi:MAG: tetratricopeptide repeat protein, partial [Bacteroidaceae bacterium]|nr:tetratricopeptide repeat protein [Bacteroidaceae bacterium]